MTPTPDPVEALNDIAAAIDAALTFVVDMDAAAFAGDQRTIYAVTYALTNCW